MVENGDLTLEMKGISKRFPGVQALDNVSFECRSGEVHGLVGENGAGKSTLIKILTGVYQKDRGEVLLKDRPVEISSRIIAQQLGVNAIYQELNLIPKMTVADNIMLGSYLGPGLGLYAQSKTFEKAQEIINQVLSEQSFSLDPTSMISDLSVAEQQVVAICKALANESHILVMDEVTSALRSEEIEQLFILIRSLCASGVSVIYITHRIDEVFEIADQVTVLRDGVNVGTRDTKSINQDELVSMMLGRRLSNMYPKRHVDIGDIFLEVKNLQSPGLQAPISFHLRRGEILGVFGLLGGGQNRLGDTLFGRVSPTSGQIYLDGELISMPSPKEAKRHGLGLIPIDRKSMGLVLPLSVTNNIILATTSKYTRLGFVMDVSKEARAADYWIDALRIQTPHRDQRVRDLSGGNQQKVVIARWLEAESQVLIMIEPSRGIDVGAKVEIYHLIEDACEAGAGVILISSELPEVLALSDRILIMKDGIFVGEFAGGGGEAQREAVLSCAVGGNLNG